LVVVVDLAHGAAAVAAASVVAEVELTMALVPVAAAVASILRAEL
jgi:hypothetical protein